MSAGKIVVNQVKMKMNGSRLPIQYLAAGEGPPIVLLHGLGDSAYSWQWVMNPLAANLRVYAVSLPGFGRSAKPQASYSSDFFHQFVIAFLNAMGIKKAVLIGNSMGGLIALRMALDNPERVSALGLVDSAGLGREVNMALRLLTLPGVGKLVTTWNKTAIGAYQWATFTSLLLFANPWRTPQVWFYGLKTMARMPGYLEATVKSAKKIGSIKGQREHEILLDRLEQIRIPTLVLWGEKDKVVPLHHARAAVSRLPDSKLVVFKDCGHLPQIEASAAFANEVQSFFAQKNPGV